MFTMESVRDMEHTVISGTTVVPYLIRRELGTQAAIPQKDGNNA